MAVEISGCQVRFARIEQVVQLISILNLLGCPADIRRILVCGRAVLCIRNTGWVPSHFIKRILPSLQIIAFNKFGPADNGSFRCKPSGFVGKSSTAFHCRTVIRTTPYMLYTVRPLYRTPSASWEVPFHVSSSAWEIK